jgi:hypothetical protein
MNNNTYLFKVIYVVLLTTLLSARSFAVFAEKSPKLNASISNECVPRKGFYGDSGSATAGAIIKVYAYDGAQLTANAGSIFNAGTITANSDGSWVWKCNGSNSCTAGANNCITNGTRKNRVGSDFYLRRCKQSIIEASNQWHEFQHLGYRQR